MRVFLLIVLTALSGSLAAQVKSRLGRFEVDFNQGCAPFTINITNTNLLTTGECTSGKPCIMTFEGTTQQQNTFQHTYNTAGTFKLTVLYQSIGADDITITVDPGTQPDFEIYRCSNNDVSIKVTDNSFEQYVINFGDASPEVAIPSGNNAIAQHDYTVANSYTIQVRGRDSSPTAKDNCPAKQQTVATLTTLPNPSITRLTAVNVNSARLEAPAIQNHILYKLEIAINNGTTFQVLQNVYNQPTIDISNLLLDNNYYCFRLSAFDPCTNTNRYSNMVCTQDFDVAFDNGVNRLTWRTSTAGVGTVGIARRDVATNITQNSTLPGTSLSHNDVDYDCNVEYCYQLTLNYAGATSISLPKCGVAQRIVTHPAVDDVTGTITNGAAELFWTIDPLLKADRSDILRSMDGGTPEVFTTTKALTITDPAYTTDPATCYKISYVDLCQNYSAEGVLVCPIRLLGTIDAANIVSLRWSKYTGWKNGVLGYAVEKFNKAGALIQTFNVGLDTFFVDNQPDLANQVVTYHVKANPVTGAKVSISNPLTFTKEVNLTFPTAFTPNADALNDVFVVTGQYVDKMNIRIFDRWGILVFASDSNEPWNGTREGLPLPESSYVWKAEITDLAGRSYSREGTLVLIRN